MKYSNEQMSLKLKELNSLYEQNKFLEAINDCLNLRIDDVSESAHNEKVFHFNLNSILIDLADVAQAKRPLELSASFFKNNLSYLSGIIPLHEYYYNWGNALKSLYRVKRTKDSSLLRPELAQILIEAKDLYWMAYKESSSPSNSLITNLASTLSVCGRIVEALQFYDKVLEVSPNFGQAHISRGIDLDWLRRLSSVYSIQQAVEMRNSFTSGIESDNSLPIAIESAKQWLEKVDSFLNENNYDYTSNGNDKNKTKQEFDSFSQKRKFYLNNHLSLSEHALYCFCIGAERDDLSVITNATSLSGDLVIQHELLLNRIKCEYSQSRELFYNSTNMPDSYYEELDYMICLTNTLVDDHSGLRSEDLRASFKKCLGILDKIAVALIDLYKLPSQKNEKIYFNSFWNNPKLPERWKKINSIGKFPLYALYYQAQELNYNNGQWKQFKDWRNTLEHGYLFLVTDANNIQDPYDTLESEIKITVVNYDEFKEKTKHLLQFTRSAIFNYVFCIRQEGISNSESYKKDSFMIPQVLHKRIQYRDGN
jgi:hypothetical protein